MRVVCLCLALFAPPVLAQTDVADIARDASARLAAASSQLQQAQSASDRVTALTRTIEAYEVGLRATQESLRRSTVREEFLTQALQTRQAEVARLVGVLQTIGANRTPVSLLHPSGPVGAARAGLMVADVAPGLQAQADEVAKTLEEITILRNLQQQATQQLQNGLNEAQEARTALTSALEARSDLPLRFAEDPVRTAILLSSTETLQAFADGLSDLTEDEVVFPSIALNGVKGELPLPVVGTLLRGFNDADAAGINRPGIIVATQPNALVTAPISATIRYRGPLLDYGNVMILEPTADTLFVIAGLDIVYGEIGEIVQAGHPLGIMAGLETASDAILTGARTGTVGQLTETLYIEVKEGQTSVDPLTWFALEKD
jgi:septal ring factor EnvC (AmiA/AmiB activator)